MNIERHGMQVGDPEVHSDKHFQKTLDKIIKSVWLNEIPCDYANGDLLKEDTLKCAIYRHIKNQLDDLYRDVPIKVFSEFSDMGMKDIDCRADIAVVQMDKRRKHGHIKDRIKDVLAIIELKFQDNSSGAYKNMRSDVCKIKKYIKSLCFKKCQFYIASIHEDAWNFTNSHLLQKRQYTNWANNRVTELSARYFKETDNRDMGFYIHSYNRYNPEFECTALDKVQFVTMN